MLGWQAVTLHYINNNSVEFVNVPGADAPSFPCTGKCWATPISSYIHGSAQPAVWPRSRQLNEARPRKIVTLPYYNNKII